MGIRGEDTIIKLCIVNIQGLVLKSVNKLQANELLEVFEKNDLILFVKSWPNEEALLSVQVNGFICFQLKRTLK